MKIGTELLGGGAYSVPRAFFSSRWRKKKFIQPPGGSGREKKEQATYKRVNFGGWDCRGLG